MNNTQKLFFALATLASMSVTHAASKKLSVNSFKQTTAYTKDAATQTAAELEDIPELAQATSGISSTSRFNALLAFMKMQLHSRHRMLGFLAHQSKNAAFWAADVSYDIFKAALKDVLKDKAKALIKKRVPLLRSTTENNQPN